MSKFCKFCGKEVAEDAVICIHCGKQIEELKSEQPSIVINNSNNNTNVNTNTNTTANSIVTGKVKNKWVSLLLLIFAGFFGAHKFYEGKVGMGILYMFTVGLFGFGLFIDFFALLFKPTHYVV